MTKEKAACWCGNTRHAKSPGSDSISVAQSIASAFIAVVAFVGVPFVMALLKSWGVW